MIQKLDPPITRLRQLLKLREEVDSNLQRLAKLEKNLREQVSEIEANCDVEDEAAVARLWPLKAKLDMIPPARTRAEGNAANCERELDGLLDQVIEGVNQEDRRRAALRRAEVLEALNPFLGSPAESSLADAFLGHLFFVTKHATGRFVAGFWRNRPGPIADAAREVLLAVEEAEKFCKG